MSSNSRKRTWCFTGYNQQSRYIYWTEDTIPEGIRYLVYQVELCPETGREHVQGYVEFKSSTRFAKIKEMFGDETMHLEARMGSAKQAADYCKKDDTRKIGTSFREFGESGVRIEWIMQYELSKYY